MNYCLRIDRTVMVTRPRSGTLARATENHPHGQFGRHPTRLACQAAALVELERVGGKAICSL
jgi:hypothetical protein